MRHIIPISGKDSICTAIVQRSKHPDLPYEYMFNPTGSELPEVFDWLDRCEIYLNARIVRVGRNLQEIIAGYNYFLPGPRARYCTIESKIEPMQEFIGDTDATVYYGIRADEDRGGYDNSKTPNIIPVYPLKESAVGLKQVYIINEHAGISPPTFFWKSVHDEVCLRIGRNDLKDILPRWIFDMLFAWRTRMNCFHCFAQRLYELVGLLEHYPELFDKMEWYEHQGGDKPYTWKSGYSMAKIRENATLYKEKRIKALVKIISKIIAGEQTALFETDETDFIDTLQVTSCGLLCGK